MTDPQDAVSWPYAIADEANAVIITFANNFRFKVFVPNDMARHHLHQLVTLANQVPPDLSGATIVLPPDEEAHD